MVRVKKAIRHVLDADARLYIFGLHGYTVPLKIVLIYGYYEFSKSEFGGMVMCVRENLPRDSVGNIVDYFRLGRKPEWEHETIQENGA